MLNHGYRRVYPQDVTALVGSGMATSATTRSSKDKRPNSRRSPKNQKLLPPFLEKVREA
jgi:hypothetical protein